MSVSPRWMSEYQPKPRAPQKMPPPGGALPVLQWNIPPYLKHQRAWAVWRYEYENGRWSKPPYQPDTDPPERAEPSDPDTWSTFEQAFRRYKDEPAWDGVSFALDRRWGLVGVDLDHTDEHDVPANAIARALDSYTELSPGRAGLRIFVKGRLPDGRRRRGWVEMYDQRRFLTVSGQRLEMFPPTIQASPALYRVWWNWLQEGKGMSGA
jgi:putative DNA primase/helicase